MYSSSVQVVSIARGLVFSVRKASSSLTRVRRRRAELVSLLLWVSLHQAGWSATLGVAASSWLVRNWLVL